MACKLEYDLGVNRATLAAFVFVLLFGASVAQAQIAVGVPASVTSVRPGGQARGVPASVTSLRPVPGTNPSYPVCCATPGYANPKAAKPGQHIHHHGYLGGTYLAPYGVPVPMEQYDDSANGADADNGGPTIFDRRGPGGPLPSDTRSAPSAPEQVADAAPRPDDPVSTQSPTVLVFKDGHQMEVANYAIVGSTLYDLTDGRRHKISLADLDLTATSKENDDRGMDFQVPSVPAAAVNN